MKTKYCKLLFVCILHYNWIIYFGFRFFSSNLLLLLWIKQKKISMLWLNQDHKISSSNHNETLLVSISYFCLFYEIVSKQTKYLYPPYLSNCTKAWGTVVSVITIALRICNTCNKWFLLLAVCIIFLIIRIVELTRTTVLWLWVLFLILYYVSPLIIVKVPFFLRW